MALKVDLSGVKSFFFEKGEKLGMIACVAAAAVLVGYGLLSAMGAKTVPNSNLTFAAAMNAEAENLKRKMSLGEPAAETKTVSYSADWPIVPSDFPQGSLFPTQDSNNDKRRNPRAIGILADPEKKQIQMTYIAGTYQAYDINYPAKVATVIKGAPAPVPGPKAGPGIRNFPQPGPQFGPGAAGAGLSPVIKLQEKRMVVVDAVLPISELLEEFRKALNMETKEELFASGELPRFPGLNIFKTEITPGKEKSEPTVLIQYDPVNDKLIVDKALQEMLREAVFEDQFAGAPFAFQGLVMAQPKLSSPLQTGADFPKAELEGIDWDNHIGGAAVGGVGGFGPRQGALQGFGGARPNAGMAAAPGAGAAPGIDIELDTKVAWRRLAPEFEERFLDKFFVLDPMGMFYDPDEGKVPGGGQPNPSPFPKSGVGVYQGPSHYSATAQWAKLGAFIGGNNPGAPPNRPFVDATGAKMPEALVRFIDPGVKPGCTYKYLVQVRIANPNFGKKTEVKVAKWAEMKELPSAPWVETPAITIPHEYFLYAINQKPDNPKIENGSDEKEPEKEQVAVQIHRWAERDTQAEHVIGDWVIAERLLLRRGDAIGRITNIEIPVWDKKLGVYELSLSTQGALQPKKKDAFQMFDQRNIKGGPGKQKRDAAELGAIGGVPINFAETHPPSVLVDFDGGKRPVPGVANAKLDESASNLLILNADGKLVVRNTRTDSDPDADPAEFKLRKQRIDDWKAKVETLRLLTNPNPNAGPPNNNMFLQPGQRKN